MNKVYVKLGQALQLERVRRKIQLADISDELKISEANLVHIEAGEVDQLPADLYFNLFAKSYAEYLGIDFDKTLEAIKDDLGEPIEPPAGKEADESPAEPEVTEAKKPPQAAGVETAFEPGKRLLRLGVIIVGAFVVFVAIWFLFLDGGETEEPTTARPAESETRQGPDRPVETESSPLDDYEWAEPPSETPAPLTLKLVAREESWAMVLADGDTVVYRNLVPWREYEATARYRLIVSVAHPSQVEITLDGTVVDLRHPVSRRVSRVEINQVNRSGFLNPGERPAIPIDSPEVRPTFSENEGPASAGAGPIDSQPTDTIDTQTEGVDGEA
jgi:cytoskeletal protein RodZ